MLTVSRVFFYYNDVVVARRVSGHVAAHAVVANTSETYIMCIYVDAETFFFSLLVFLGYWISGKECERVFTAAGRPIACE